MVSASIVIANIIHIILALRSKSTTLVKSSFSTKNSTIAVIIPNIIPSFFKSFIAPPIFFSLLVL